LVGVSDKNGAFTVEDIEVGGQAVLGSFGASEKRRARFYYDGTFRVKRFRDSSGAWHRYTYDPSGALTGIRQPDGSSVSYGYDRDGLLARIASRPDGTVVSFAYSASGRVRSFTVREPGEEPLRTKFSYGTDSTRVSEPEGIEVHYTYGSRGIVSSVSSPDATGPDAFTCVPAVPDEPDFVNPEPEEPAGLVPQASVCPPGEERQPVGWEGPNEPPRAPLPVDPDGAMGLHRLPSADIAPRD
jgi:YD repeat-containing protein